MSERKLQKKMMMGITIVVVVTALSMLLALEIILHDMLIKRLTKEGEFMAKHIAEVSATPILTEKYFELEIMVKDLEKNEKGVSYVYISDRNGRILAHTFQGGFPVDLERSRERNTVQVMAQRIMTSKGHIIDISAPVLHGTAGMVHLGLSEEHITKDIHAIIGRIIGLMLVILVIMYIAALLVSRRMIRPVLDLARVAGAVGEGDLSQKVEIYTDDEIGDLIRVFNEMIRKRRMAEQENEILVLSLKKALDEVKTLNGLLPICSWCKKIRNDEGYWTDVEAYITEKTDADFSHGICPECYKQVRNELGGSSA